MNVEIVAFPRTKVGAIEHRGSPAREHDTARKLGAWKREQRLLDPSKHCSYGIHYTDPGSTPPEDHRVDFCLSIEHDVAPNSLGIVTKIIPANRCARARDIGQQSRCPSLQGMVTSQRRDAGRLSGVLPLRQCRTKRRRIPDDHGRLPAPEIVSAVCAGNDGPASITPRAPQRGSG